MYALVADIENYPQFVPLCQNLTIQSRQQASEDGCEIVVAEMTVAYKLIRETFECRVKLDPNNQTILVSYLDGPFRTLENRWSFKTKGDKRSDVDFFLAYEFRNAFFERLMGAVFDRAFGKFSEAFEVRANAIYGHERISN